MGACYEQQAAEFLKKRGLKILQYNFHCRLGEVDLIAQEGNYLCFIEVKYRKTDLMGYPEDAVDKSKQKRICRVSEYYLLSHGVSDEVQLRYDVVAVTPKEIRWHKNAFSYIPG